jgi:hypothetical protein
MKFHRKRSKRTTKDLEDSYSDILNYKTYAKPSLFGITIEGVEAYIIV